MTTPEPVAYESLERRLDEVLGADPAATLKIVLSSLATKDDLARVEHDLGLLQLDLADFKKDAHHEFTLVRTEMESMKNELIGVFRGELNAAITAQTKPLLISLVATAVVFAGSLLGAVALA